MDGFQHNILSLSLIHAADAMAKAISIGYAGILMGQHCNILVHAHANLVGGMVVIAIISNIVVHVTVWGIINRFKF